MTASLSILVAEDDPQLRAFAGDALGQLGHRPVLAPDGAAALAVAATEPVDLLFTDVVMPAIGGLDLARALVARVGPLPIVVTSGQLGAEAAAQLRECGVTFLPKPYDHAQLGNAVSAALRIGPLSWDQLNYPGNP